MKEKRLSREDFRICYIFGSRWLWPATTTTLSCVSGPMPPWGLVNQARELVLFRGFAMMDPCFFARAGQKHGMVPFLFTPLHGSSVSAARRGDPNGGRWANQRHEEDRTLGCETASTLSPIPSSRTTAGTVAIARVSGSKESRLKSQEGEWMPVRLTDLAVAAPGAS